MISKNTKKVAVIYSRTATRGSNIKAQELACKTLAEKEGYANSEVIRDYGKSGGNLERLGMKKLIDLVCQEKIKTIFTFDAARLSRSISDYNFLKKLFEINKIDLVLVDRLRNDKSSDTNLADAIKRGNAIKIPKETAAK